MRYKDIDFSGLSKILRAHATQIVPPGMRELKNVYVSRSDNAVSMRPDFLQETTDMPSISEDLQGGNYPEFLTGIYRVLDIDGYIYFPNFGPFSFENGERIELPTTYDEGSISTSGSNPIVNGSGTEWLKYVWAGCLIREADDPRWYQVLTVDSDTYLTTSPAMHELDGAEYEVLRPHPAANGAWPMRFEKLGDMLVYNPANPTLPVDKQRISGPFFSDIGKADIFGVWKEFEPPLAPIDAELLVFGEFTPSSFTEVPWDKTGEPMPLLLGGRHGMLVSNEQWIGDYNSENSDWAKIRDAYTWEDTHGRLVYPRGNGYPTVDIYQVIPWGSEASIVGLSFYFDHIQEEPRAWAMLDNGYGVKFSSSRELFPPRTPSLLREFGPWIPTTFNPPEKIMEPTCRGIYQSTFAFGSDGQIVYFSNEFSWSLLDKLSDADIFACVGGNGDYEFGVPGHGGIRYVFVGGVDSEGATVIVMDEANFGDLYRIGAHHGIGDNELYDVTFMFAQDLGNSGYGTFVAVGENGTIIYSDDGGDTWDPVVQSISDAHLRCVEADNNGQCVLAGGDGGICLVSTDGEEWEEVNVTTDNIIDISYDSNRGEFLVLTDGGTDPIRVKRRMRYGVGGQIDCQRVGIISTLSTDAVFSIVWDGSQFIAAGSDVWTSPDGVTWTDRGVGGSIACLAHDGSGTVVGAGEKGLIVTSTDDGVNWSLVYAKEANAFIDGPILSVVWDGHNFLCCGDKVILKSADGLTWLEDDKTFEVDDEPVLMVAGGEGGFSVACGLDYGGLAGALSVICKSGNLYRGGWKGAGYTDWALWPRTSAWLPPVGVPDEQIFEGRDVTPGSMIRGLNRLAEMVVSVDPVRPHLWTLMAGEFNSGEYVEHQHLSGYGHEGPREPDVLRHVGAAGPTIQPSGSSRNCLLAHDLNENKMMDTPILFWVRGTTLTISTDLGRTWSKNYPMKIPTRNGVYDAPVSGVSSSGLPVKGALGNSFGITGYMAAMVSDGTDVFIASQYAPEGLVLAKITWDGLRVVMLDPDEIPAGPEVIPPTKKIYSNSGEKLVFTVY